MKKSYRIEIDCANCARKVEESIGRTFSFWTSL